MKAYLDVDEIIRIASENGVDAIHPGYGFLSESPELAAACAPCGEKWAAVACAAVWPLDALGAQKHLASVGRARP